MRADRAVARWIGIALVLLAVVATLWLAATGRLELYVHPRYTVFTVVLAVVGGVLAVAGIATGLRGEHGHGHGDDHDLPDPDTLEDAEAVLDAVPTAPVRRRLLTGGRLFIAGVAAVALLVLPPATLSAATAQSRTVSTTATALTASAPKLVGGSTSSFTVKDWAGLLRSGDTDAIVGQTVHVSGYVLPQPGAAGKGDVVFVARLLVTCCAVDAQPVGIPVVVEDWRAQHPANSWVELTGRFQENPDPHSDQPFVVVPTTVKRIAEPDKPYVY